METVKVDFNNQIGRITANDATPAPPAPVSLTGRVLRWLHIPARHVRLTQVIFQDVTDLHNELVQEREWLLHPSERLALSGNLFAIENILTGEGWLIIKTLPLPHARPVFSPVDLFVERIEEGGFEARVVTSDGDEQSSDTTILSYGGGTPGSHLDKRQIKVASWRVGLIQGAAWQDP